VEVLLQDVFINENAVQDTAISHTGGIACVNVNLVIYGPISPYVQRTLHPLV
jgi:hypothetical protein